MEMAAVMMKSVELDEKDGLRQHELLVQLKTENDGLRQLLAISRNNGSITTSKKEKRVEETEDTTSDSPATGTMVHKKKVTTSTSTQTDDGV